MIGTVVIAGNTASIRSLELRNGRIQIRATFDQPCVRGTGPATIFGADGKGCWQGQAEAEVRQGDELTYEMKIVKVYA